MAKNRVRIVLRNGTELNFGNIEFPDGNLSSKMKELMELDYVRVNGNNSSYWIYTREISFMEVKDVE